MNKKGFTIIEAIIVISLISVFSAIIISNFSAAKLQFSLSRVVNQFEQDVSRAQNMALSAAPYKDSSGVEHEVDGYGIYINLMSPGNTKYILYADKTPGNDQYDVSDYVLSQIDFGLNEPDIVIKQIDNISSDITSINFKLSNLSTSISNLTAGQNSIFVVFAQSVNLNNTKSVNINKSGLIKIQ